MGGNQFHPTHACHIFPANLLVFRWLLAGLVVGSTKALIKTGVSNISLFTKLGFQVFMVDVMNRVLGVNVLGYFIWDMQT